MSLVQLMPMLEALPREEKIRAIQFLAGALAQESAVPLLSEGQAQEVRSPNDSFEAAAAMLELLDADNMKP